ncbi:MAG: aminopeptidase, partial [Mycobacterium sp.]|nr:aminopeptidase [Mycobacterium sp.]
MGMADGALSGSDIELLRKEFSSVPAYRRTQNAVTQVSIDDVALDRGVVTSIDPSMSHTLDDWKVTNQKKSGRCWAFAGLNLLRVGAMQAMNLKDFEFSQNYVMFWDKLERANYFLESVIQTADRDLDDRTVAFLLESVLGDGGQWNMFVALVRKHGLVPKQAMPETESSSNSAKMNSALRSVLRQGALRLREMNSAGTQELRACKKQTLTVLHRVLTIHLGTPPERFIWQWTDKDREFHRDGEITPTEFAAKYVTIPIDDYVCLVDDPRETSPRNATFTVDFLGNVVGGEPVIYLN